MTSSQEAKLKEQYDYCGITPWHEAGKTGIPDFENIWIAENDSGHGRDVRVTVLRVVPTATVYNANISGSYGNDYQDLKVTYEGEVYTPEEFIVKFKIKYICRSVGGGNAEGKFISDYWNALKKKYNLVFTGSVGNDDNLTWGNYFPPDVCILVGAYKLLNGKPIKESYSLPSDNLQLDFMCPVGLWMGTSAANPWMLSQCKLVGDNNAGITQESLYEYFKKYAVDMDVEGLDNNTGYGAAVLGNHEEVFYMEDYFDDDNGHWAEEAINYCAEKGYITGDSEGNANPDRPVTFAQLCQFQMNVDKIKGGE